jgi:hypothetical protein
VARHYGVNRATLFRDGKFAEALDHVAKQSRHSEILAKILSREVRLSAKEVVEMAGKEASEIRDLVQRWLIEGKKRQRVRKPSKITLPKSNPQKQAQTLFEELGADKASKLIEELSKLVKDGELSDERAEQ